MNGTDHLLFEFVLIMLIVLVVLYFFYWAKQSTVVAYIVAGVLAGPFGFGVISDVHTIQILGELGVLILLFFIGLEVSLSSLIRNWRVVILGSLFQILASVLAIGILGYFLDWDLPRIILLGFVTSLSSTAVILSYLESKKLLEHKLGKDVFGVLLAQDILIAPMLIIISALGGSFEMSTTVVQVIGAFGIGVVLFLLLRKRITLPTFAQQPKTGNDHKVFISLILCFGAALITGLFHLSLGLGAFAGGLIAANISNFSWVKHELHTFKTLFMALFFVSVGLLIDITFLQENIFLVLAILLSVFCLNTVINMLIFLWLKRGWRYSLYAGALLAPLGEFSFFLASAGLAAGALTAYGYQLSILVIAISLIVSPFWAHLFEDKSVRPKAVHS